MAGWDAKIIIKLHSSLFSFFMLTSYSLHHSDIELYHVVTCETFLIMFNRSLQTKDLFSQQRPRLYTVQPRNQLFDFSKLQFVPNQKAINNNYSQFCHHPIKHTNSCKLAINSVLLVILCSTQLNHKLSSINLFSSHTVTCFQRYRAIIHFFIHECDYMQICVGNV